MFKVHKSNWFPTMGVTPFLLNVLSDFLEQGMSVFCDIISTKKTLFDIEQTFCQYGKVLPD